MQKVVFKNRDDQRIAAAAYCPLVDDRTVLFVWLSVQPSAGEKEIERAMNTLTAGLKSIRISEPAPAGGGR